jgi:hypothetical protein
MENEENFVSHERLQKGPGGTRFGPYRMGRIGLEQCINENMSVGFPLTFNLLCYHRFEQ